MEASRKGENVDEGSHPICVCVVKDISDSHIKCDTACPTINFCQSFFDWTINMKTKATGAKKKPLAKKTTAKPRVKKNLVTPQSPRPSSSQDDPTPDES